MNNTHVFLFSYSIIYYPSLGIDNIYLTTVSSASDACSPSAPLAPTGYYLLPSCHTDISGHQLIPVGELSNSFKVSEPGLENLLVNNLTI